MGGLAVVFLSVIASPGPNILIITQFSMSESRLHGIAAGLGVASGTVLWGTLTVVGLAALFLHVGWLQPIVQVAGGLYLGYVAWKIWRGARGALPAAGAPVERRSVGLAYRYGLTTNLLNPKAMVFYSSVFSVFLGPSFASWARWASLAMIIAISIAWYTTVAILLSIPRIQAPYRRWKVGIDRATAATLGLFGALLLAAFVRTLG